MKNSRNILSNALLGIFALTVPATAAAQDEGWAEGELPTHVRAVGELSPGTSAPSVVDMESAARDLTNPTRLTAMLEYGERVECHACVPILEERLLTDGNPEVREIAAWETDRNAAGTRIRWMFTTERAREKLGWVYRPLAQARAEAERKEAA